MGLIHSNGITDGDGRGTGIGYGNSYGIGHGIGYGYCNDIGDGYGYGSNHGYSSGSSSGSGYGNGISYGGDRGDGSGYGIDLSVWPSRYLDPILVLKETNIEIRRDLIKEIGVSRVIQKLSARSIEKRGNYELLDFDINKGRYRPYLKMLNPSIGVWHVEGVHPSCYTIEEALRWRNQTSQKPDIIT